MIEIGREAPMFNLRDEQENEVRLSDYRGRWVVLYFYPKDNTPGCTTEALEFTSLEAEFFAQNAVVMGISADSCASHQKFVIGHHLQIKLLSDPERTVLKAYDAWGQKKLYGKSFLGITRSTVLVDPAGRIAWHWPKVKAVGHAAVVLERLRTLQK